MKPTLLRALTVAAVATGVVAAIGSSPAAQADPTRGPGPHPRRVDCSSVLSAGTREEAFARSAAVTGVPVGVLKAVSYLESRWDDHAGKPSADGGYGPMNLTDLTHLSDLSASDRHPNRSARAEQVARPDRPDLSAERSGAQHAAPVAESTQTLTVGARLTGLGADVVRTQPNANICAGAAVLASYRDPAAGPAADVNAWTGAVSRFGTAGAGSTTTFTAEAYTVLRQGATRVTADGQRVRLAAEPGARVLAAASAARRTDCPARLACDWVPAPYLKGDPSLPDTTTDYGNHDLADRTGPGGPELDYIVIHDTEGSYDSSLDLVQDPTYVAWNYTVRSSDGQVAQHLNAKDVGWHAGNWYLNMHSIGVEHEGRAGTNGWYTEAMYRSSATLVKYLAHKYDIPLDPAHIIGHDQVPGVLPGYTASVHWDPGPYWDWEHYFELLGAPIGGRASTTGDVAVGDVVTVRPGYAQNANLVTACDEKSPGSGPCQAGAPTNFAELRQAPSATAPLATDVGTHPKGSAEGTTSVNDVSARAQAGNVLVVAEVSGEWVKVSWAGEFAWIHNPASRRVLVRTPHPTVAAKTGAASAPVYGRAYPERAAYPSTVAYQAVTPVEYTLKPGQSYAVTDQTVVTDYYNAKTYDGTVAGDRTDVRGTDVYYQIALAHRLFYVRAADVQLTAVPVLVNQTRPTIDGTARVGRVLTALTGQWTGGAKRFTYQWERDGRPIAGATDQTYPVRRADAQRRLTVVVTAAAPNAGSVAAESRPVRVKR